MGSPPSITHSRSTAWCALCSEITDCFAAEREIGSVHRLGFCSLAAPDDFGGMESKRRVPFSSGRGTRRQEVRVSSFHATGAGSRLRTESARKLHALDRYRDKKLLCTLNPVCRPALEHS